MQSEIISLNNQNNIILNGVENKSLEVVNQIKNLTLLSAKDVTALEDAQTFILSTYTDVPEYRPMIIKLAGVLNDAQFPTIDMKYWQTKKEAEVHFNELIKDFYKLRRAQVDVKEIEYTINQLKNKLEKNSFSINEDPFKIDCEIERLIIKKEEYLFNMKHLEKEIKYRISEVVDWAKISKQLESKCNFSLKNYDDHLIEGLRKTLLYNIDSTKDKDKIKLYESQLKMLNDLFNIK